MQKPEKKDTMIDKWGFQDSLSSIQKCLLSGEHFILLGPQKFGKTKFIHDLMHFNGFNRIREQTFDEVSSSFELKFQRKPSKRQRVKKKKKIEEKNM